MGLIKFTQFRMVKLGLVPVESDPDERTVEYLIREHRTFRRCLQPPEMGCRYIPDLFSSTPNPRITWKSLVIQTKNT